jgi:hypothetical protein
MSSAQRETVVDPEQGGLDIVLPSDLRSRSDTPSPALSPASTFLETSLSTSTLTEGVLTSKSDYTLGGESPKATLPSFIGELSVDGVSTPTDAEGAPIPAPDTSRLIVSEKAVTPLSEKESPPPAPKPKPAGKPGPKWVRASKWIRFKIWYNTYR